MSKKVVIDELSTQELEAILADKKRAEKEVFAQKRRDYEAEREQLADDLGMAAVTVYDQMLDLKAEAMYRLARFRELMLEYGDLRRGENNKGSFEIKNDRYKIVLSSHISKKFDERAELAEEKLKAFLLTTVKKRDQKLYKFIMSLLERNERSGDFDINLISRLYAIEDDFEDQNWKDAIRLFKESYSPTGTVKYARFYRALPGGGWEAIVLDFAKIKAALGKLDEAA